MDLRCVPPQALMSTPSICIRRTGPFSLCPGAGSAPRSSGELASASRLPSSSLIWLISRASRTTSLQRASIACRIISGDQQGSKAPLAQQATKGLTGNVSPASTSIEQGWKRAVAALHA